MGTRSATEHGLRHAGGRLAVAARVTGAARVAWIDDRHADAAQTGLVLDEAPELGEGPAALPRPLAMANRGPRADVRQVFERNPARGVLSRGDDRFADHVVLVSAKAGLPSRQGLQPLLGAACAATLQATPVLVVAPADALDGVAGVGAAVAIGGQVHDAEIDAEERFGFYGRAVWQVDRGVEVERAVTQDEIHLALDAVEPFALVGAVEQADAFPAAERQQANRRRSLETQDAFVVGHGAVRAKYRALGLVAAKALDGLPDGAHGHLRRQAESLAQLVIAAGLNRWGAEELRLEPDAGRVRRSGVECPHRRPQGRRLVRRWHQSELQRQLHGESIGVYRSSVKRPPPRPEGRGFLLGELR